MFFKQSAAVVLIVLISGFTFSWAYPTDLNASSRKAVSPSEEEDLSYDDSLENSCPPNQFWHIRGRQCVPLKCLLGNSLRDWNTGLCLHSQESIDRQRRQKKEGFQVRTYIRPVKTWIGSGRYSVLGTRYEPVTIRKRVELDYDTAIPIKNIGIIG